MINLRRETCLGSGGCAAVRWRAAASAFVGVLVCLGVVGCEAEAPEPEPVERRAPPPPPPPPPDPLAGFSFDPRVEFPEDRRPFDAGAALASAELVNALAKGDRAGLASVLTPDARVVLNGLVERGSWPEGGYEAALVTQTVEAEDGSLTVAVALQRPEGAVLTAWRAEGPSPWRFRGVAIERQVAATVDDLAEAELAPMRFPEPAELLIVTFEDEDDGRRR